MNKRNSTIRSFAAEYLAYVALTTGSETGIEMRYEDGNPGGCN